MPLTEQTVTQVRKKPILGAIMFKSSISLLTVKPLHCNLAIEDIIKALFSTAPPSIAFRITLFCLINAQLLITVFRCGSTRVLMLI